MLSFISSTLRRTWVTDVIFLGLACFIFYGFHLGHYPLFTPDEGRYSEIAREMIATGDYITPRVNGVAFLDKPILYYWLQAAAIHLFGLNEWALRFFPMLFGIFGCLATYLAGRHVFDRRTGILSAIILATSPLYFVGAHYANLDLEVAVWVSVTLLSFLSAIHSQGKTRTALLFAAYICAALAALTKGLIGIVFPTMIIGSWILLTWRWGLLKKIHLIAGLILFAALVIPWFILVQRANPGFLNYFFVTQQVTRFLSSAEFNNKTPSWFYFPIVIIGFFPWTIFLCQSLLKSIRQLWNNYKKESATLFLLLWVTLIFIFFSIPHSKIVTYILPIFPALALLVGNYLSAYWEKTTQSVLYIGTIAFVTFTVLHAVLILLAVHYHWVQITPTFVPYLTAIIAIFALSALLALLCFAGSFYFTKRDVSILFVLCTACSIAFLSTLTMGAEELNANTAKPLIRQLKPILKPEDDVASYFKYYQDVALYLGRRITVVADWDSPEIAQKDNWIREFWVSLPFQKAEWLINEKTFWQRWSGKQRIFVFVNANYMDEFKKGVAHQKYYLIGQHHDILLFSNRR